MNKRNVMFIRPFECRYCCNGFFGLGHTVDYAASKSFNITDLQTKQADNPYIDDTVNSFNPYMIYFFGHGNVNVYTANSETPVWIVGEDLTHLAGRILYGLSCLTANQLGPYIVQQGALGYGGFLISWTWMSNDINGDPYEDTYANCFYRSTNKFFESLLDGNTLQKAMNDSIAEYNYWIDWWTNSGNSSASEVIKWLIHDRDGLIILGDPNASTTECEEILNKQECLNAGCWWYDGSCHCEKPGEPVVTYDFTIKAMPSKAKINKYESLYPIGYKADNDGYSWVDYNMRIQNVGRGVSNIFMRIENTNISGDLLWNQIVTINPGVESKYHTRINTSNTEGTHQLTVGHIQEGLEVIDESSINLYNAEECKRLGGDLVLHTAKESQSTCKNNLIGIKYTPAVDCDMVALEFFANITHFFPDAKIRYAIYKSSDGSMIKNGIRSHFYSGRYAKHRINLDEPLRLNAGEEYWFTIQKADEGYGFELCYRENTIDCISGMMALGSLEPLPNIYNPIIGNKEYFIWALYKEI